jgi:hypothetical protein
MSPMNLAVNVSVLVSELITVRGSTGSSALRQTQVSCSNKHTYPNRQHPFPEDGSLGVVAGQEAGGEGGRRLLLCHMLVFTHH